MSILDVFKKKRKPSAAKPEEKKLSATKTAEGKEEKIDSSISKKGFSKEQNLLIRPYLSEKFTLLKEQQNKYIFEVNPRATKNEIKKLLENIYNVEIVKINVINASSKPKRWRQKKSLLRGNKKVIVTLKKDQKIELGI